MSACCLACRHRVRCGPAAWLETLLLPAATAPCFLALLALLLACRLDGCDVAVKFADRCNSMDIVRHMENEVAVYQELQGLQGNCIPRLAAFGYTVGRAGLSNTRGAFAWEATQLRPVQCLLASVLIRCAQPVLFPPSVQAHGLVFFIAVSWTSARVLALQTAPRVWLC